jgi:hypothetical protein
MKARRSSAALGDAKADLAAMQASVVQRELRLGEAMKKYSLEEECRNTALQYDKQDWLAEHVGVGVASKNRWDAFRRVILLTGCLSAERRANLHREFGLWERAQQSRFPSDAPGVHVGRFGAMLGRLLALIQGGRPQEVCHWWDAQCDRLIGHAQFVFPPLSADS